MRKYDLRDLGDSFYGRMGKLIESGLNVGEVGIFVFEVGNFDSIQKSADFIRDMGHELMNSLKLNEVDWTIVVKKLSEEERAKRKIEAEEKRIEAERVAKEEVKKAPVKRTRAKRTPSAKPKAK